MQLHICDMVVAFMRERFCGIAQPKQFIYYNRTGEVYSGRWDEA